MLFSNSSKLDFAPQSFEVLLFWLEKVYVIFKETVSRDWCAVWSAGWPAGRGHVYQQLWAPPPLSGYRHLHWPSRCRSVTFIWVDSEGFKFCVLSKFLYFLRTTAIDSTDLIPCEKSIPLWNWFVETLIFMLRKRRFQNCRCHMLCVRKETNPIVKKISNMQTIRQLSTGDEK